jgi:uncharacterized phage-associated protein
LATPIGKSDKKSTFVRKIIVMAHKAIDIAKTLISFANPEYGDFFSNLKIQKLLYYAQGLSLALHQKPLFDEKIVAWQYGPVVEEVYHEFKQYNGAIPPFEDYKSDFLTKEEIELLKEVYDVFGQFSATKLVEMTHSETPWRTTAIRKEISHPKLRRHFLTLVQDEQT